MGVESRRVAEPLGSVATPIVRGPLRFNGGPPWGLRQQPGGSVGRVKLVSTLVAPSAASRNKIYQVRRTVCIVAERPGSLTAFTTLWYILHLKLHHRPSIFDSYILFLNFLFYCLFYHYSYYLFIDFFYNLVLIQKTNDSCLSVKWGNRDYTKVII